MKRGLATLFLLVTAMASFAASPASSTTVGEDSCVAGPDVENGASPDWLDLCSLSVGAVATGGAPELDIALTVVGDAEQREAPATYRVSWVAGACAVSLQYSDHLVDGHWSEVTARCGEAEIVCGDPALVVNCEDVGTTTVSASVPVPEFVGDTVRWQLRLDGDLAALAPSHQPGNVVTDLEALGANAFAGQYGPVSVRSGATHGGAYCVQTCSEPVDDVLVADRDHVIG